MNTYFYALVANDLKINFEKIKFLVAKKHKIGIKLLISLRPLHWKLQNTVEKI